MTKGLLRGQSEDNSTGRNDEGFGLTSDGLDGHAGRGSEIPNQAAGGESGA